MWVNTPVFDGAHWDEEEAAGKHPTIQSIFENLNAESVDGKRMIQTDGKTMTLKAIALPNDHSTSPGGRNVLK